MENEDRLAGSDSSRESIDSGGDSAGEEEPSDIFTPGPSKMRKIEEPKFELPSSFTKNDEMLESENADFKTLMANFVPKRAEK